MGAQGAVLCSWWVVWGMVEWLECFLNQLAWVLLASNTVGVQKVNKFVGIKVRC